MRSNEMCLQSRNAFPFFDDYHNVVALRPLNRQTAHGIDRREVFDASAFRADLGHDFAKFRKEGGAFAGMQLDRGEYDDHGSCFLFCVWNFVKSIKTRNTKTSMD